MKPLEKYTTLFSLYIAQSVPMSFFSTVLPVIMRMEKFSLSGIAMIQLVKIPWILKFLWAPAVDYKSSTHLHYKRWVIVSEFFYAATILLIAFFSLKVNLSLIIALMVIAIFFSATQDIASDALAIRILRQGEQPYGNSMQSMGTFAGTLIGSGFLLLLYVKTGWSMLMVVLAAFVLVALVPLSVFVRKKEVAETRVEKPGIRLSDFIEFFRIRGMGKWILVLTLYYSGFLGILSLLKPWMVDQGYSIRHIAFMVGIFGTGCGAAGALLGGAVMKKIGYYKSLLLFGCLCLFATAMFLAMSLTGVNLVRLYASIAMLWISYAMASVAVYTISMTKVRKGKEGTDYSMQIVITHLQGLLVAMAAGKLADKYGYTRFFGIETILAVLVVIVIYVLFKEERKKK